MTYLEFREKNKGKYLDYDGKYGAQCWDLVAYYFQDVLKIPVGVISDYMNVIKDPNSEFFKYFTEVKLNEKKQGDIEIFSWTHMAIMDHWNEKEQVNYYFSQNSRGTGENPKGPSEIFPIPDNNQCRAFRKKENSEEIVIKLKKGDKVIPLRLIDYHGQKLNSFYTSYIIVEEPSGNNGDYVVLGVPNKKGGYDIWAALNKKDVKKI